MKSSPKNEWGIIKHHTRKYIIGCIESKVFSIFDGLLIKMSLSLKQLSIALEFGKKAAEEIEALVVQEAEDCDDRGFPIISLWIFFNILTWYITHRATSLNQRVEMERR